MLNDFGAGNSMFSAMILGPAKLQATGIASSSPAGSNFH
jgi:hypothetical protein